MSEHVLVLALALLIGVVAGSHIFTAPAVLSWSGLFGWIDFGDKWSSWIAHSVTVGILTVLVVAVEWVGARVATLPDRRSPSQFAARLISGGFSGAVLGSAWDSTWIGLILGVVGAVIGTLCFHWLRTRLDAANGGDDRSARTVEDIVALGGGVLIALALV